MSPRLKATIAFLLLLLILPTAEARVYKVRDCDGSFRNVDSKDPGNYTDGQAVDLCARGYYGFSRMIFIGQLFAAPAATIGLLIAGFVFFTAGGNATRRVAAGSTCGVLALGLFLVLMAGRFVDLLYNIFGGV